MPSPVPRQIQHDLKSACIYLAKDKGVCKGMVTLNEMNPKITNRLISIRQKKTFIPAEHGCASEMAGKGIAKIMVEFAQKLPRKKDLTASGWMFSNPVKMQDNYMKNRASRNWLLSILPIRRYLLFVMKNNYNYSFSMNMENLPH